MEAFRICPVGDQAVLCEFDNEIDVQTNDRVQYLAVQIKAAHPKGVTEVLPTYRSLLIFYDQAITTYRRLMPVIKKFSSIKAVSYTHLDVYKRQLKGRGQ